MTHAEMQVLQAKHTKFSRSRDEQVGTNLSYTVFPEHVSSVIEKLREYKRKLALRSGVPCFSVAIHKSIIALRLETKVARNTT